MVEDVYYTQPYRTIKTHFSHEVEFNYTGDSYKRLNHREVIYKLCYNDGTVKNDQCCSKIQFLIIVPKGSDAQFENNLKGNLQKEWEKMNK